MKQVSYVISTYTSDVSGVCSALYELGGMVVIHDPSGCNSTYNTHDEPRWFDQDSLIFISGLSQMDAVMGEDDKFIEDVLRAAEELNPRFIVLVRSPIPLMIGTDFDGIAREIRMRSGIPTYFIPTTGMKSYVKGAGMALEMVVNHLMPGPVKANESSDGMEEGGDRKVFSSPVRVNIIGATPLDFSVNGMFSSLKHLLAKGGFSVQGSLALDTDFEEMCVLPQGDVNLVVTGCGLLAAKAMKERFGIPYVIGFPCEGMKEQVLSDLLEAAQSGETINSMERKTEQLHGKIKPAEEGISHGSGVIVHEPVIARSLAIAFSEKSGKWIRGVSMTDVPQDLVGDGFVMVESEEEMAEIFAGASFVAADPMYAPICPEKVPFYILPHEAFSGRIFRKCIPDLLEN